ncbi:hypothetical protein QYE76_016214 [Lolium multiflorum]|uniref:F-box domain-containing protein n=1 Tax=Lolium multiflorum TaxID=4521 RepID=A0AAD8U6A5_LOLMU|nr:hypothetical protein QYE76_016214 [Lolium multiflorum]
MAPRRKKKARAAAAAPATTTATATLPDDVVFEILALVADDDLPALFRCAVACKSWPSLVADPSFLRRSWPEGERHPSSLLGLFVASRHGCPSLATSLIGPPCRVASTYGPASAFILTFVVFLFFRSSSCGWSSWTASSSRYEEETSIARGGEEQLDVKLDKKLDMKISHERAREEREECARGEEEVQAGRFDAKKIWSTHAEPKCKLLGWLALHGKLLTADMLGDPS